MNSKWEMRNEKWEIWEMRFFLHTKGCGSRKIVIPTNLQITFFCAKFAAGSHELHTTAEPNAVIVRSDGGSLWQWWRRTATVFWANGTMRWCHLTQTWFRSVNLIVKQSIKRRSKKWLSLTKVQARTYILGRCTVWCTQNGTVPDLPQGVATLYPGLCDRWAFSPLQR